jgi:hypothetical protein
LQRSGRSQTQKLSSVGKFHQNFPKWIMAKRISTPP